MTPPTLSLRPNSRRQTGITLIELMIVVTLIGTLTMISIPAYKNYAERAHRTEAIRALMQLQVNQENFRIQNDTFADDPEDLGFAGGCSENCVYLISFDGTPDTQSFTARAVPNPDGGTNGVDQSSDDTCSWFTIDETGRKQAENDSCLRGA